MLEGSRLEAMSGVQGPLEESADARLLTPQNDKVLSLGFRSTLPLLERCSLIEAARYRGSALDILAVDLSAIEGLLCNSCTQHEALHHCLAPCDKARFPLMANPASPTCDETSLSRYPPCLSHQNS